MKFIIDDANIESIKEIYEYFSVDGVTTNPTILWKVSKNPFKVLKEIREFIGKDAELHVQVISKRAEDMIDEANHILNELGNNTFIKIPVTKEGVKAIKLLKSKSINITATAVYNSMQGYLAAKAGADYIAPYINRIDNLGFDGIKVAKEIHDILKINGFNCEVLGASFKNSKQVLELAKYGVGAATIGSQVIEGLLKIDAVNCAVETFTNDFENLCGKNKTMKNI
ncbi:fructose-6-phosphate aldolase [Clostridium tarantellae]|uniref:Fructose-6-phosphate aldolase n=1 Tax=Clostridium tarantellae TaxID=39493 RepID=A0A6I1MHU1_9CLOT|nr:fructose-6-phosphate aldolase [Clostridium tarantellae]MPQ42710.1 fructose-6-phosphate aldolase [Clostridium tarantellae]